MYSGEVCVWFLSDVTTVVVVVVVCRRLMGLFRSWRRK